MNNHFPANPNANVATRPSTPDVELTILMPCLNEARTLESCVKKALSSLAEHGVAGEVLVADNGSTDGSPELAERLGARVVHVPKKGYGAALNHGVASARGRYVMMADSDGSYDVANILPFLEKLNQGHGLVMGNRFRGGILPGAMPPLHRYFGNPLLTAVGRLFFKSPVGDFYCGQRAFRRDEIIGLDLQATGMEYALEMLVRSTMQGLSVAEVPVTLSPDGRDRPPHLRSWRDGWRSLRLFLIYSPRWLFLYPGLLLVVVGLLMGGWLLGGPGWIGRVRLDIHTLFYCAGSIAIGFQLVLFSIFGKMLSIVAGLHPRNPALERRLLGAPLEKGLIAGSLLLLLGLVLTGVAIGLWAGRSFGDLDPFRQMRIVIPAVLAMMLGLQVIASSFYLSLLQVLVGKLRGAESVDRQEMDMAVSHDRA